MQKYVWIYRAGEKPRVLVTTNSASAAFSIANMLGTNFPADGFAVTNNPAPDDPYLRIRVPEAV